MASKKRINPFSVLIDLLIDFVLIGMGVTLYYHFLVNPLTPLLTLSPAVIKFFGSLKTAVYVIAGTPFVIGVLGLGRTLYRVIFRTIR